MGKIKTALPKGRMMEPVLDILKKGGLIEPDFGVDVSSRELVFEDEKSGNTFLLAKPKDVPAYVEHGAADIGITGKDVIREHGKELYELLDLKIGSCRLVLAVPESSGITELKEIPEHCRIATSYPRITRQFFENRGIQVEIIKLYGSVELAPLVELSDFIVDITSTGTTLKENNLIPIAEIMSSSARLVVNSVSYRTRYERITDLINQIDNIGEED